jgi:N-acetyl-beta-hexosaminidase
VRALSLAAIFTAALLCPSAAEAANPAPDGVPSIREWSGGTGMFQVDPDARIVVGSGSLAGEAEILRDDLANATGYRLRIVDGGGSRRGDVILSGRRAPAELGPEGYVLEIGDRVEVRGGGDAGVFYGTQTVVQALRSQPGNRTLPRGTARDWPRFRERGYLLDVGRKYWSPDFVVQTIGRWPT